MRLLVFQHIDCEHPGSLRTFLAEQGVQWDTVELDAGEKIPPLENYHALWVMGGPMDVWEVDEHPWLREEKAAIRRWVRELKKPYLGLCLGHQLLADALGGKCAPQRPPEIGILEITLTEEGNADALLGGCRPRRNACNGIRSALLNRREMQSCWRVRMSAVFRRCGSGRMPGRCNTMSKSSPTRSTTGEMFPRIGTPCHQPSGPPVWRR